MDTINTMIFSNQYPILLGNGFSTRYDEQFFKKSIKTDPTKMGN